MKYKKMSRVNECALLARSLGIKCRVSPFGISILNEMNYPKFFSSDELYMDNSNCKKYIKSLYEPTVQTTLEDFS